MLPLPLFGWWLRANPMGLRTLASLLVMMPGPGALEFSQAFPKPPGSRACLHLPSQTLRVGGALHSDNMEIKSPLNLAWMLRATLHPHSLGGGEGRGSAHSSTTASSLSLLFLLPLLGSRLFSTCPLPSLSTQNLLVLSLTIQSFRPQSQVGP